MAKFRNPWAKGGLRFPDHVSESVNQWFDGDGLKGLFRNSKNTLTVTKKVILFGGVDYYNEGEFGINLDIANSLAIANEPYKLGLVEGSVQVFNSPLFADKDFETDIYYPVLEKIKNNFDTKTGTLIFYGYSWGANIIMNIIDKLNDEGINVDFLLTIDAAKGPVSISVKTTVTDNVDYNLNIYQTQLSKIGSHGYQNSGKNVMNINLTGETNSKGEAVVHANIDDFTKLFSTQAIIYALTGNNAFHKMSAENLKQKIKLYESKQ